MQVKLIDVIEFYKKYPEHIGKIKVETRFGYKVIEYGDVTAYDSEIYKVKTSSGKTLKTSPDHLLLNDNIEWVKVKNLKVGDILVTRDDLEEIVSIELLDYKDDLYDLQVEEVHEFYANDIVSHNSLILDAFCFVLFNKSFRGVSKKNLLINSINKKNCLVECDFDINEDTYLIRRGLSPVVFEIYKNGQLINQEASAINYQLMLEKSILKMNYKTFTQIVVLGSSNHTPFLELTPQNRREVVNNILDINVISVMSNIVKEDYREVKEIHSKSKNDLNTLKVKYIAQNKVLKTLQDSIKNTSVSFEKEIKTFTDMIEDLEKQLLDIKEFSKDEIDSVKEKISIQKKEISELENKKYNANQNIKKIKKDIKFYEENHFCSQCQQEINDFHKNEILEKYEEEINFNTNELKEIEKNIELLSSSTHSMIQDYNIMVSNIKKINDIKNNIQQLENTIKIKRDNYNTEDIQKNIDNEKKILLDISKKGKEAKIKLEEISKKLDMLDYAVTILKDNGFKSVVIKEYLPIINKLINIYLEKLDSYYSFEFDEQFNETVLSRHVDEFQYANLSGGERIRLTLSILFTWRYLSIKKNTMPCNLLILDEIFSESLDEAGVDAVIKILRELENTHCFILSPNAEDIKSNFNDIIMVEKVGDFSNYNKQ